MNGLEQASARIALHDARTAEPHAGRASALLRTHGSLELRFYAPRVRDDQTPHERDELYVVASERGWFVCGEQRLPFGPGDALFAAAGTPHRFEVFSDDFATWVMFYGPQGGE